MNADTLAIRVRNYGDTVLLLTMLHSRGFRLRHNMDITLYVNDWCKSFPRGYVVLDSGHPRLTGEYGLRDILECQEFIDTYLVSYNDN